MSCHRPGLRYRNPLFTGLLTLAGCGGGCGGDEGLCDATRLADALSSAGPGDTVRVGECTVAGSFTVPAGVTLAGSGRGTSLLRAGPGERALVLTPGDPPAQVRDLAVESDGAAGIVAIGAGSVAVERVDVRSTRGIALGAEGVSELTLSGVSLTGPVTADNAVDVAADAGPDETATHGLVLVRVASAELADVTARGFAAFGALFVESVATWNGGGASASLATGLMVQDGGATLRNVSFCDVFRGFRLEPAYGLVIAGGASVESEDLEVCACEGVGVLQDGSSASHVGLRGHDNESAALWVQGTTSFELGGASTELAGNGFAGLVVVDSEGVSVTGAHISDTRSVPGPVGELGAVLVGDGIQLLRTTRAVRLEDVTLTDNERVGVLVDLGGGSAEDVQLAGVTVDAEGDALGVVTQDGDVPADWDSGVTRQGATAANDAAHEGTLDVAGAVGPECLPDASALSDQGLEALLR